MYKLGISFDDFQLISQQIETVSIESKIIHEIIQKIFQEIFQNL